MDNKKETALSTSVGADEGQSTSLKTNQSITENAKEINEDFNEDEALRKRLQDINDPGYIHVVSMTELYQLTFKSRPPIIGGLLYGGAYILAGAPKIGKSFLVAQLAYHVSSGEPLWGMEVKQGEVFYLALEDDLQRLQKRMFMMYGVYDTPGLFFATASNKLNNGFEDQLDFFIKRHPDTRLIIIDTIQKIREAGGEAYSYANDYEVISRLKQYADKHNLCILTVHHTRKQPAGDSMDTVSGTQGLTGCADGAFVMQKAKRTSNEATIDVVSRDVQDQILYLKKDPDTQIWSLEKTETDLYKVPPDPVLEKIASLVSPDSKEWNGSPSELAEMVNVNMAANALSKYLNVNCGRLLEEYFIGYENKQRHTGRRVSLTYIDVPEA